MKCLNCNGEYSPKRKDAKYCSYHCRKEAFKRSSGTDNPKEERINGTDNKTDNFKVFGQSWSDKKKKTQPMYFCSEHQDHCKSYCLNMCNDECHHILKVV